MTTYLNNLTTLLAGHPLRGSIKHSPQGETAVVQMKDVSPEQGVNLSNLYRINLTGHKTPDYLKQGDILFMGRGYRIFAVLIKEDLATTVASPHFFMIRVKSTNIIQPAYLAWYINHKRAQRYFSQHSAGTALPHINRTALEKLPIILPPINIQERIINVHQCRLKEQSLLHAFIKKKMQLTEQLLDHTLNTYQKGNQL